MQVVGALLRQNEPALGGFVAQGAALFDPVSLVLCRYTPKGGVGLSSAHYQQGDLPK